MMANRIVPYIQSALVYLRLKLYNNFNWFPVNKQPEPVKNEIIAILDNQDLRRI